MTYSIFLWGHLITLSDMAFFASPKKLVKFAEDGCQHVSLIRYKNFVSWLPPLFDCLTVQSLCHMVTNLVVKADKHSEDGKKVRHVSSSFCKEQPAAMCVFIRTSNGGTVTSSLQTWIFVDQYFGGFMESPNNDSISVVFNLVDGVA